MEMDLNYLTNNILFPAIAFALNKKVVTKEEHDFLKEAIKLGEFKAGDINKVLKKRHGSDISRLINKLKIQKMIYSLPDSPRRYGVSLVNIPVPKWNLDFKSRREHILICDQSDLERHPLPVSFWDGYNMLLRGVIHHLREEGFIAIED